MVILAWGVGVSYERGIPVGPEVLFTPTIGHRKVSCRKALTVSSSNLRTKRPFTDGPVQSELSKIRPQGSYQRLLTLQVLYNLRKPVKGKQLALL